MMYGKAKLFGDDVAAEILLKTIDPKQCKEIGRGVQGFVEDTWNSECERIVSVGCREKFLQNRHLLEDLLATGDRLIVEASPYDKIWGNGLKDDHPNAMCPDRWPGENRLGKVITELRDDLVQRCTDKLLPERAQEIVESTLETLRASLSEDEKSQPRLG